MLKVYCDFEFSPRPDTFALICVVCVFKGETYKFNLQCAMEESKAVAFFYNLPEDVVLVSYNIEAEVKALMCLFDTQNLFELPVKHFICLYTEHKLLANIESCLLYTSPSPRDS